MYLSPLIRFNRAISSTLILPDHPIKAIAISEVVSILIPILNTTYYARTIGHIMAFLYNPSFISSILENYEKPFKIYYQLELFLFIIFYIFNFLL